MRSFRPCLENLEDRCVPATITVTNLNEGTGAGVPGMTLREAVEKANLTPATDSIVFKAGLKGTLTLTDGVITITTNLTLKGPGASKITISGNDSSQIFLVHNPAGVSIKVTVSGLSLTGGFYAASGITGGAAIENREILTLKNCSIHGNQSEKDGGGVFAGNDGFALGALTVSGCSFFDNKATRGGALANLGAELTVSNSSFAHNRAAFGGAVFTAFTTTLQSSSLIGNGGLDETAEGGAVCHEGDKLKIIACTIRDNAADQGGGVAHLGGIAEIVRTTLVGNVGDHGGGIFVSSADVTVLNSTLSANRSNSHGGGIAALGGTLAVHNSTLAFNEALQDGGGLQATINVNLVSTIVARNFAGNDGPDLFNTGFFFVLDHSLVGDTTDAVPCLLSDSESLALQNLNPLLGPLQDNGGPTLTHALLAGSPALNAGSNPDSLTTDQRGAGFPRIKGSAIDIGAFER